MDFRPIVLFVLTALLGACATPQRLEISKPDRSPLVLMTDFSLRDGAVSAMRGVAFSVDASLNVSDLTHEIPPFDIWQGAYRLAQTYSYWPAGTVFVAVVDPGVGSERASIVLRTRSGHTFVGPDNGLFTLVAEEVGIESVHRIDESRQRLKGSQESYTFHGRDLYVYVAARLASGRAKPDELGESLRSPIQSLAYQKPEALGKDLRGIIAVLDPNYGNVWSNLPKSLFVSQFGSQAKSFEVRILNRGRTVYKRRVPLVETFSAVPKGQPLLYFNSLLNLSLALNQGHFAQVHKIGSGPEWTIEVTQ